jgi:hypothetical protein
MQKVIQIYKRLLKPFKTLKTMHHLLKSFHIQRVSACMFAIFRDVALAPLASLSQTHVIAAHSL